jgi:hypothetical protein
MYEKCFLMHKLTRKEQKAIIVVGKMVLKYFVRQLIFRLIFEDRINEIYTKISDYKITAIINHRSGYPVNLNFNKIRP